MNMKLTRVQELEAELRAYVGECQRLRKMAVNSVKMSGEIDLIRI